MLPILTIVSCMTGVVVRNDLSAVLKRLSYTLLRRTAVAEPDYVWGIDRRSPRYRCDPGFVARSSGRFSFPGSA